MLVKQIMNRSVVTAKPDITLKEASKVMSEFHIGSLIIVKNKKIVGILTSSDILKAVASDKDPNVTLAEEIMSKNVKTIEPDKDLDDAVLTMIENKIKRLPVVSGDKLVGILTASDIIVIEPKLIAKFASLLSLRLPSYSGG